MKTKSMLLLKIKPIHKSRLFVFVKQYAEIYQIHPSNMNTLGKIFICFFC